ISVNYCGKKGTAWTPWDLAAQCFFRLITNPKVDKFAGPCARCHKYYVKKRASQKVYCSRTCGNAATAVRRTREKWEREHTEKLLRARRAIQEWRRCKPADPWKDWIERKYPDITKKFLTRAVNAGELSAAESMA